MENIFIKLVLVTGLCFGCDFDDQINSHVAFGNLTDRGAQIMREAWTKFKYAIKDNDYGPETILSFFSILTHNLVCHSVCSGELINTYPKIEEKITFPLISGDEYFGQTKIIYALGVMSVDIISQYKKIKETTDNPISNITSSNTLQEDTTLSFKYKQRRASQKDRKKAANRRKQEDDAVFEEAQEQNLRYCETDTSSKVEKMLKQFMPESIKIPGKKQMQVKIPVDHPNIDSFLLRAVGSNQALILDRLREYAAKSISKIDQLLKDAQTDDGISLLHLHRLLGQESKLTKLPNETYQILYHTGKPFPNLKPAEGSCYVCESQNEQNKFVAMFFSPDMEIRLQPNIFYADLANKIKSLQTYSEIRRFLLKNLRANKSVEDMLKTMPVVDLGDLGYNIAFCIHSKDRLIGHYNIQKVAEFIIFVTRLEIPRFGNLDFYSTGSPVIFKSDIGEAIGDKLKGRTDLTIKNIIDKIDSLPAEVHPDLELIKNARENEALRVVFRPSSKDTE